MLGTQVACGSGLERIYRFLQSDEPSNRLGLDFESMKVGRSSVSQEVAGAWCSPAGPKVSGAHAPQPRVSSTLACSGRNTACAGEQKRDAGLQASSARKLQVAELRTSVQSAPEITQGALEKTDPLSMEAVDLFLAIVGAEAGYMGLRILASGGIYICGGIIPRVGPRDLALAVDLEVKAQEVSQHVFFRLSDGA